MRLRKLTAVTVIGLAGLLFAPTAKAQTTTTGAVQGTVTDEATGVPMLLVTVVATSPKLQGQASEFTDASGQYYISNLPPGTYGLLFVYGDAKVRRDNVEVRTGAVTSVNAKINQQATEVVTIKERAPAIDAGSTKQGATLQQDYLKNVPNRGRTYDQVLGAAGGAQTDLYGTGLSGSQSVENSYIVDGVNTTGLKYGDVQSPVLNNFIQEIEIITGGYNAEFGRSTGGVVNVVTKTGSNEFHGSVWANVKPFEAKRDTIQSAATAFQASRKLDADLDFGFDVGGPIIKDKLWFYVGFAPYIQRTKNTRIVSTNVDRAQRFFNYNNPNCQKNLDNTCDGDGNPATTSAPGCELQAANGAACESDGKVDVDSTNNPIFEEIDRGSFISNQTNYQFTGKLNFAVTPDHQGQVSFVGSPSTFRQMAAGAGSSPALPGVNGTPNATQENLTQFIGDASFKWTSKFNNNKTQFDIVLGWHKWNQTVGAVTDELPNDPGHKTINEPFVSVRAGDLNGNQGIAIGRNWDQNESQKVLDFCRDEVAGAATTDQFPRIRNCSFARYALGGPGITDDLDETRMTGKLTLTQRVKALGHHQFKAGIDVEVNRIADVRRRSGDYTFIAAPNSGGLYESRGFVTPNPTGADICGFDADDMPIRCDFVHQEGLPIKATTLNWAAFIQDSWSILPNLTVNAGLRYEEQRIGTAEREQGVMDPITGGTVPNPAIKLSNLFAPRVGLIYDWTREGRSKVYANWGKFYESVPMDMNERAFGGESLLFQDWSVSQCGAPFIAPGADRQSLPADPRNCPRATTSIDNQPDGGIAPTSFPDPVAGIPAGFSIVVPGIKAQSMEEFVAGVEYEVLEDLRVGLSYQNRRMTSVIEDMSTDGGITYYLGNPASFPSGEDDALINQIMNTSDSTLKGQLTKRLQDFRLLRQFPKPIRDFNAVQLTASKRFSRNFMVQGSYTYSRLKGNYPGLFQSESGQLDPNITSQYDLVELIGNRYGYLPGDRPHQIKLDGYYTFDLEKAGRITTGLRFRAQSGVLTEVIGNHRIYHQGTESWILPRDISGRSAFGTSADLHIAYARRVGEVDVEVYFDLFNLLNSQYESGKDSQYTLDNVHPIIGGDTTDLAHAKAYLSGSQGIPVVKNLNWDKTQFRALPLTGRMGLTLSF